MAQGVKLVRLSDGAALVSVSVCEGADEEDLATTNNEGENT